MHARSHPFQLYLTYKPRGAPSGESLCACHGLSVSASVHYQVMTHLVKQEFINQECST